MVGGNALLHTLRRTSHRHEMFIAFIIVKCLCGYGTVTLNIETGSSCVVAKHARLRVGTMGALGVDRDQRHNEGKRDCGSRDSMRDASDTQDQRLLLAVVRSMHSAERGSDAHLVTSAQQYTHGARSDGNQAPSETSRSACLAR
jgi:hypothetical protein